MGELLALTLRSWAQRLNGDRGQALIEYALIITLVVTVVLLALVLMGHVVKNLYCNIQSEVGKPGS